MSGPLTYGHFESTGWQDCANVWENGDVDFSSGNTAEEIVDRSLEWMSFEDWRAQNDDFEGLDPKKAYQAWKKGWRAGAIVNVMASMQNHLTKAETEFQAALTQGGIDVAQDIVIQNNLRLAKLGEKFYELNGGDQPHGGSIGEFYIDSSTWVRWEANPDRRNDNGAFTLIFHYSFRGQEWSSRMGLASGAHGVLIDLKKGRQRAVEYAWHAVKIFTAVDAHIGERAPTRHELNVLAERVSDFDHLVPITPEEIYQNPGQPEIKDEDNAVDKYREFNSFDPKDLIYVDGSPIPKKLRRLGEATQLLYESMKVIPDNGVKPRKPVGYFHDHDGDVYTYVPDDSGDTDTPDFIVNCDALVLLGTCIGYTIKDKAGKTIEAKATKPYPEFYTTPNGRALLVVQSKKTVLAIIYGGGLGVESRGIVG